MSGTSKDDCDAEPAGGEVTDRAAAEFDPLAIPDDEGSARSSPRVPVPAGLPVSDAEYRTLKERARTRRGPSDHREDAVAQEDGDDFEKGGEGTDKR